MDIPPTPFKGGVDPIFQMATRHFQIFKLTHLQINKLTNQYVHLQLLIPWKRSIPMVTTWVPIL